MTGGRATLKPGRFLNFARPFTKSALLRCNAMTTKWVCGRNSLTKFLASSGSHGRTTFVCQKPNRTSSPITCFTLTKRKRRRCLGKIFHNAIAVPFWHSGGEEIRPSTFTGKQTSAALPASADSSLLGRGSKLLLGRSHKRQRVASLLSRYETKPFFRD